MTYKTFINKVIGRIKHHYYQVNNFFLKKRVQVLYSPSWFADKRVAIIGGADSAYEEKMGKYIDDFDVVVRINKGVEPISKKADFIGRRTDILFHCFYEDEQRFGSPITPELWRESGVGIVVRAASFKPIAKNLNSFLKISGDQVKYSEMTETLLAKASYAINDYHPTTGFLALHSIIDSKPKELFITGITFLKTPHSKAYRDVNLDYARQMIYSKHNTDLEFDWFCDVYRKENNQQKIKPDRRLIDLMDIAQ